MRCARVLHHTPAYHLFFDLTHIFKNMKIPLDSLYNVGAFIMIHRGHKRFDVKLQIFELKRTLRDNSFMIIDPLGALSW